MRFNRIFLLLLCLLLLCGCKTAEGKPAEPAVAAEDFLDSLVFLGDSTTAHMLSRAPLKDGEGSTQIWASKNRYLNLDARITAAKIVYPETGEELTVAEAVARKRPPYLVITLGVDYGVYYYRNDPAAFARCYEKLLDAIAAASPDTRLILQSIFPVAKTCSVLSNDMIDRANGVIAEIAARRGLVFVDANSVLKDERGYLAPHYCSSEDGIHLTAAAYQKIFENLKRYEKEITKT
jgi:hypothetical protein